MKRPAGIPAVGNMFTIKSPSQQELDEVADMPKKDASTHNNKRYWNQEEDERLTQLVHQFGAKNWKKIASYLDDRTDVQCLHRWQKVLNPSMIKGPWSAEED